MYPQAVMFLDFGVRETSFVEFAPLEPALKKISNSIAKQQITFTVLLKCIENEAN
jgi:hypothetical protein